MSDNLVPTGAPDALAQKAEALSNQLARRFEPMVDAALDMFHEIPSDPTVLGLQNFNALLSQIRHDANQVSGWLQQAIKAKRSAQATVKKAKLAYEERIQALMTADPTVRDAPGGHAGRETAAKQLAVRERRVVSYAETIYTQVLGYHEALKTSHDNLQDTKADLMRQLGVVREQIKLGEVNPGSFPLDTPGISPPVGSARAVEADVMREIAQESGTTSF